MSDVLEYKLLSFGSYTLTVAQLAAVFLVWILAWLLLRGIHRLIHRDAKILTVSDKGRRHSLFLIARYFIWTIAAAVMLESIGVHVTVVLAGSAALLVGLGLGVQQIFRDIMSGIFLLFEGAVEVDDILVIDDRVGRVMEINLRTSKLITADGITMIVPNHKFITENLVNWSHQNAVPARFSVAFGVSYDADAEQVKQLVMPCAAAHPYVITDDSLYKPELRLVRFKDEKMVFELLFWTHKMFEVEVIRSAIRFSVREKLSTAGISMNIV